MNASFLSTSPPSPWWASSSSSSSSSSFSSSSSSPPPLLNSTEDEDCPSDDSSLRLPLAAFYSLFFVLGLVGNLFALWVFLFLHSSRNSVRVFLINCAVADLVLLACLPFRVAYHLSGDRWALGPVACRLVGNLFYMNMYISIMLLGLISLDRYLRLQGKGRARRGVVELWGRSLPWSWVACGALWGLSVLSTVPMVTAAEEDRENATQCFQFRRRRRAASGKAYFNGALVVAFWLVFVMLVVSYAKIASQLMRASRDKPDLPNARKYRRTARKSFFVLFLFTLCFGPYHAFRPVYILTQLGGAPPGCAWLRLVDRTNEVTLLFSAFNSCLDPVMYLLLSGSVRKTAVRVLGSRLGGWLPFLQDATSTNSSTADFRRPSVTPSGTPRTSICVVNGNLRRTGRP